MIQRTPLAELLRPRLRNLLEDLGSHAGSDLYRRVIDEVERVLIEEVLRHTRGNRKSAASMLGIHRNTLRQRMARLGIRAVSSDEEPQDPFV